ncbi:MAG: AMP-binding protein [Oscillospiraceae bacterium]
MKNSILDFFDITVKNYPNNIAVGDVDGSIDYKTVYHQSQSIATAIAKNNFLKKPVAILMSRGKMAVAAMLGVLYSGNFYIVLDSESPIDRLSKIINTLSPAAIIYEQDLKDKASHLAKGIIKINVEKVINNAVDDKLLAKIRSQILITDPAYSIFTSGSTGIPKGALLTHQNVISYMDWFINEFKITDKTVFGSQTPLYFSMSVSDLFASIFTGGEYQMIPKEHFTFPVNLINFMNDRKVNTIYWVPSAFGVVAKMDLFKYCKPDFLEKVFFAGEVMPIKYLNYWKFHFPDLLYANLFGPTETTDICSFYVVDRDFSETNTLPIGVACRNSHLFVVDEHGKEITDSRPGELFVAGPTVAIGYYNNTEKTKEVFVQNPLQNDYPEIVYKTGDIVRRNKHGEFEYMGRKDFQIKHMGYRIEPGEIENAFGSVAGIGTTVCFYDVSNDSIVLAFEGDENLEESLILTAQNTLPVYMQPNQYRAFDIFPKNQNGKIDRKLIETIISDRQGEKSWIKFTKYSQQSFPAKTAQLQPIL